MVRVREAPRREFDVLGLPRGLLQPSNASRRSFSQIPRLEDSRPVHIKPRFMLKLEANTFTRLSCGNCGSIDEGPSVIAQIAAATAAATYRHHRSCGAPRPDGCREETISFLKQLECGLCVRTVV